MRVYLARLLCRYFLKLNMAASPGGGLKRKRSPAHLWDSHELVIHKEHADGTVHSQTGGFVRRAHRYEASGSSLKGERTR